MATLTLNEGKFDRAARIVLGIILVVIGLVLWNPIGLIVGIIGLIPLFTGIAGWCPLYAMFGINTCPLQRR